MIALAHIPDLNVLATPIFPIARNRSSPEPYRIPRPLGRQPSTAGGVAKVAIFV
jgi:hypothetical protein